MRPTRSIGTLLAIALATVPATGAEINRRSLGGIQPVKLSLVRSSPDSLLYAEVRFVCTFATVTNLFDRHRTSFNPERFAAIAVWEDRASLWNPQARADVITSLYIPKDRIAPTRSALLVKYQRMEISGIVKDIVEGEPQIEVTGLKPIEDSGAYDDASIYHVEQAIALTADGARDLADEHFAKALETDLPIAARLEIATLRGRSLLDAGRFDLAVEVLGKAVEKAPQDPGLTPQERSQMLSLLAKAQIEIAERGNDAALRQVAVDRARAALAADPANGEAYAVLGIGLAGLGQFDEARRNCDSAVRLRPADAEVRWYLGRILDQQGRQEDSIDALKKAIDLTPKDWRIHKAIAAAYHHRGLKGGPAAGQDLATSLREYDITLRLNPGDADALVLGGGVIEDAVKIGAELQIGAARQAATSDLSLARYAQAIQLDGASLAAWRAQGLLQAALGKTAEAAVSADKLQALGAAADADAVRKAYGAPTAESTPAHAPGDPSLPAKPAGSGAPAAVP